MKDPTGWKSIPIAGIIPEGGTARKYKTGEWKVFKPVLDEGKCINCLVCWIYCPEPTINQGEKVVSIDLTYCKGCGICEAVCPVKAINMVED